MKLKEVDIVCLHHPETVFNVGENTRLISGGTLGGKNNLAADIAEREANLLFTVGISVGGVKKADSAVIGGAEQPHGVVLVTALKRQTAERGLGGDKAASPQYYGFHRVPPL